MPILEHNIPLGLKTRPAPFIRKQCPLHGSCLGLILFLSLGATHPAFSQDNEYTFLTLAGPAGIGSGAIDGTLGEGRFAELAGAAVDGAGNLYTVDWACHTIRKIETSGRATTVAGLAGNPGSADGVGSTARFNHPYGVAADQAGNLFVTDRDNHTIRKISPDGIVVTIAGLAQNPGAADGTGIAARFNWPTGIAVDGAGNLYVADSDNYTIRKIETGGVVTTVAGSAGKSGSANGSRSTARFDYPHSLAVDGQGNIYVTDYWNNTIRMINPEGIVTTIAGSATASGSMDGTGSTARFLNPRGLTIDGTGNLYVADSGNELVRKIDSGRVVTTIAGLAGNTGNADGAGAAARFNRLQGIAVDSAGSLYVAESGNHDLRKIAIDRVVTTVSGTAERLGMDDGIAGLARFNNPWGIALSGDSLYVADSANHTIRKIGPGGVTTTVAGLAGTSGTANGSANIARFRDPRGVVVDGTGNVYVADRGNHAIRKINSTGTVTTFAGQPGSLGFNNGTGTAARFLYPTAIAMDSAGNLYVAEESGAHTIRKITPGGAVTTFAGSSGSLGSTDGTGNAARFNSPQGIAVDGSNYVYVADTGNHTIRKITPAGKVTTLAGKAAVWGTADEVGSAARFDGPTGLAADSAGNLYVTDMNNCTIRKITPEGSVTTVAGFAGCSGNLDATGHAARFHDPCGITVDGAGNLYVADTANHRICVTTGTCPDRPTIDLASGPVGALRQLDATPQTATHWQWRLIRRPSDSIAELSSRSIRNPVFLPDVADLYIFELSATNESGEICVRNLEFHAAAAPAIPSIVLTEQENGHTGMAALGQSIYIDLRGNPSTGYEWILTNQNDSAVASTGPAVFTIDPGDGEGRPGTYRFPFQAVHDGVTTLSFVYIRSWDPQNVQGTFAVTIHVGECLLSLQPIRRLDKNRLLISWPIALGDACYLEGTLGLSTPQWSALNALTIPDGFYYAVTISTSGTSSFFRLHQ